MARPRRLLCRFDGNVNQVAYQVRASCPLMERLSQRHHSSLRSRHGSYIELALSYFLTKWKFGVAVEELVLTERSWAFKVTLTLLAFSFGCLSLNIRDALVVDFAADAADDDVESAPRRKTLQSANLVLTIAYLLKLA